MSKEILDYIPGVGTIRAIQENNRLKKKARVDEDVGRKVVINVGKLVGGAAVVSTACQVFDDIVNPLGWVERGDEIRGQQGDGPASTKVGGPIPGGGDGRNTGLELDPQTQPVVNEGESQDNIIMKTSRITPADDEKTIIELVDPESGEKIICEEFNPTSRKAGIKCDRDNAPIEIQIEEVTEVGLRDQPDQPYTVEEMLVTYPTYSE